MTLNTGLWRQMDGPTSSYSFLEWQMVKNSGCNCVRIAQHSCVKLGLRSINGYVGCCANRRCDKATSSPHGVSLQLVADDLDVHFLGLRNTYEMICDCMLLCDKRWPTFCPEISSLFLRRASTLCFTSVLSRFSKFLNMVEPPESTMFCA